jgi:hypothetical protein
MTLPAVKLHVRQQEAHVLLDPIRLELNSLTRRLDHYLGKATIDDASVDALKRARAAIRTAAETIASIEAEGANR